MVKIKDLSKVELPREKLVKYGTDRLLDKELLAIILGSGIEGLNVLELAQKILLKIRKIGIEKATLEELLKIKGLGNAKASQIVACLELGRRLNQKEKPEILSPKDIWNLCADIRESKKEHFVAFYLDTQERLIERQIISVGTLTASLVHPREVFEPAVRLSAASVIVAHNHPSGSLEPSEQDRLITRKLVDAGGMLDISIVDHIIFSKSAFKSLKLAGIL
jgi:DNA repair protein RadC